MNLQQVEKMIIDSVKVSNHEVALAKGFLISREDLEIDTRTELAEFVSQQDSPKPKEIVIHNTVFIEPQIRQVQKYFTFSIAFCEAVHSLINSGYFLPKSNCEEIIETDISYTIGIPSSSRYSGGMRFPQFGFLVPQKIIPAFSRRNGQSAFSDPDVFVLEMGISNAHKEVKDALKDTILCFKNDLFHPSIIMLGKALEGAWIELGISLSSSVAEKRTDHDSFVDKLKGQDSFARKVKEIVKLYEKQDWFKTLKSTSGVDLNMIREIKNWTDILRDARNAIHFGVESSTPNTYEKASILLLGAVKNFRALYKLKQEADKCY